MKTSKLLNNRTFALSLLSAFLAGCAMQGGHHGPMHGSMQGGQHGQMDHHAGMDMKSMCAMHKQMMEGKTAAQQQALMDDHMKSMPPEMRQRMQEMHAGCK